MAKVSLIVNSAIQNVDHSRNVVGIQELTERLLTTEPWSPVLLKAGQHWLTGDNFESIQVLALDIDGGMELTKAVEVFKPFKHIIGTSRNHQKQKGKKAPCDRFRVVLFFDTPITSAAMYKHTFTTFVSELGLNLVVDPLKDVARFFYPCVNIISTGDGVMVTPVPVVASERKMTLVTTSLTTGDKGKLTPTSRDFVAQLLDNENNFHSKCVSMLFDAKAKGYDIDEARELMLRAAPWGHLDAKDEARLKDIYSERRESFFSKASHMDWPEMTRITDKSPYPKPVFDSVKNVLYVLSDKMALSLLYDERAAKVIKNVRFGEHFSDTDYEKLRFACLENKIMSDPSKLATIVKATAYNNTYDAFAALFDTPWDKVDRLDVLFKTMKFKDDETAEALEWYRQYLYRWLRAVARKYYEPGSQNNVLVLSGKQGIGKSRWLDKLSTLWPDGYKEGQIDPSNKDHALVHLEKFMWHIAELDNTTNNKDVSALKDFLTRGTISERRAYARVADTGKSICSFCASVNSTDFLHDNSGNRRFLVLPLEGLDTTHNIDIKQLFAQVGEEYKAGLPWYFSQDEIQVTETLTNQFKYKDQVTERLELGLKAGTDRMSVHEIVSLVLGPQRMQDFYERKPFKMGVSNLLMKLGIPKKNHSGRQVYCIDKAALLEQVPKEGVL